MKHRSAILVAVGALAIAGCVFLLVSLYRSIAVPSASAVEYTNKEAGAALEQATQFLTPLTPEDRAEIPARLAEAARPVSPTDRDRSLLKVFRQRMELLVSPDYQRYVEHVAELTGQSATSVRQQLGDQHQTRWENAARLFQDASYSTDGCEIIAGERDLVRFGGQITTRRDPGVYGSERLLAGENPELIQVRLPVILAMSFDGEGQTLLVYLVMAFVWDEARANWMPYVTGLYDPMLQEDRLPAPWI